MSNYIVYGFGILLIISLDIFSQSDFNPPPTEKLEVTDTIHNFIITDQYRWLEDKENEKVKSWSEAQHKYTIDYINKTCSEIAGLRDEIRAYIDRDYRSAPFYVGFREFFYSRKKGDKHSKLYTILDNKEILIFDPMKFDSSGLTSQTGLAFTRDGNKFAVGLQLKGNEISDYYIIDTKTGAILGEPIKDLSNFSWTFDEQHAYITERTKEMIEKQIPLRTYLHTIGSNRKDDIFLAAPNDAKDFVSIWDPKEGNVTFISEGDFWSNTLKIRKVGTMDEPKVIYSSDKYKANPNVKNNKIYFYTNYEAPNFKIMVTELNKPEFENWKVFYPEKETVLESYIITSDWVIIKYKKDVLSRLSVYDLSGKFIKILELPELGDVGGISYHEETNTVFVSFNVFDASSKMYKLDGKTLKWEFFYQDKPPIETKDYESKIVYFYSKDSTRIPMFIVHKKGLKLNGNNPALLYGYGGFNAGMGPGYVGITASFINRGGVYAIACIRGGNEYGEKWHQDGMLFKKQNTFDDFAAAAEFLINEKYTNSSKLAVKGGSNGGLLIGAMLTQRPDLFKVAVCAVPLLDMIRYHKFLIARYWIPEYGDPEKKDDFLNLIKYSPYHNIKASFNYPTTLIKAGENDSRVDPLHAKKFTAALRNNPGQKNPILLYIDFESGHGSGQSTEQMVNNIEIEWRFLMNQLGMK